MAAVRDAVVDAVAGSATGPAVLAASLARSGPHRADVLVVEGAAGAGKTPLVRQAVLERPGVDALWASGDASERALPFGVAQQLLRHLPGGDTVASGTDPFVVGAWLLDGLCCLRALDTGRTVVVVVDDLHWIDDPSARALLYLLRRLHEERIVAVLTVRPGGADRLGPSWRRLLADPDRTRWVRLGGTPERPGADASALPGLTARERVVAAMVGRGLTNREVAGELFVSVKAVEFHLRNIFGKLDLRSRRQLRDLLDPAVRG